MAGSHSRGPHWPAPGLKDARRAEPAHGVDSLCGIFSGLDQTALERIEGSTGPRGDVTGASTFMSLPARDRQALKQTQKDKYPEEYGPAIEQYLKNLSDQENR